MDDDVAARLAAAGCISPHLEASELVAAAVEDAVLLEQMVERRSSGEPLAWIVGSTMFAGIRVDVHPGVYVPRPATELVAARAAGDLPEGGTGIDLCTGCGAVAMVLARRRPTSTVVASDLDPVAVACARANGVAAYQGDMFAPLPPELRGTADVVVGVVPYVPTPELAFLARDVRDHEPRLAHDGGATGLDLLDRAVRGAAEWLRTGGALVLELGGEQATTIAPLLGRFGFGPATVIVDDDGDVRGITAQLMASRARHPAD